MAVTAIHDLSINVDHTSPNFWQGDYPYMAIVIHRTAGQDDLTDEERLSSALGWLCNPTANASAHFVIHTDGTIYELVNPYPSNGFPKGKRAWANGPYQKWDKNLSWLNWCINQGVNPNEVTISLEHVASSSQMLHNEPMPDAQLQASAQLVAALAQDFNLAVTDQTVIGHFQIDSVNRPYCPGLPDMDAYRNKVIWAKSLLQPKVIADPANGFAIGDGVKGALQANNDLAATNEQYYVPAGNPTGLAQRSYTWGQSGNLYLGFQTLDANGNPSPAWDVSVWRRIA